MTLHTDSVEVDRPVRTVYNQWTQFESFPEFMDGVESITQLTDTRTHWVTKVAGVTREFDAEITVQVPDERVAWTTEDGPNHSGTVSFQPMGDARTKVTLEMDFEPEGVAETAGEKVGVVGRQLGGDLKRFKDFIESQPSETGAWRGSV